MSVDSFKILEDAFKRAVQLGVSAKEQFVSDFQEKNPALGDRLRRMLAVDDATIDQFGASVSAAAIDLRDKTSDPWLGKQVGAWTITDRVGEGGMGTVFLAVRSDEQYKQTVAVKIMGSQLLNESAVSRFRAERQILANLNHPNIATLIDGGATDSDLPYLVMEFVGGEPLDRYCDLKKLNIEERLELFQKVCLAVDYANRNLVVHRDLKPSNILVTNDGEPKILDFGIAKLLETDDDEFADVTKTGARPLTPNYASPEQIRGEPVSVGSDVYALGVLLFRLLTGASPYGTTTNSPRDIENAILETTPVRPSASIGSIDTAVAGHETVSPDEVSANRSMSLERLRHKLAGDLDTIVLKCLQKDPARRYSTARDLADDLQRYIKDEPIIARPDSWSYVASKFLKRNFRPLLATAVATISAIGLVTFYTIQLTIERDRAEVAAEQARKSEAEAQLAAAQAEEVSGFLSNMLRSSSPHESDGNLITAVDLLEAGVEQIETLSAQPILQANLYRIMGYSFTEVGDFKKGLQLHEKSVEVLKDIEGVDPLLLADNLFGLAEAQSSLELNDVSVKNRERVLEIRKQYLGQNHPDTLYAKIRLGSSLDRAGQYEAAIKHLSEAIDMSKRIAAATGHTPVTLDSMGVGSVILSRLGRYQEAKDLNAEAIQHSEKILGELDPNTVIRVRNSAVYTRELFQLDEAMYFHDEGITRGAKVWPEDSPVRTYAIRQKAITLHMLGRYGEALELLENLEPLVISGSGENSLRYASFLITKGDWYFDNAQYDEALSLYARGRDIAVELNGKEARAALAASIRMARTFAMQNRLQEADRLFSEALKNRDSFTRSTYFFAMRAYADALSKLGRMNEAGTIFQKIHAEKEVQVGADSPALGPILADFATHERRKGNAQVSVELASRATELVTDRLPAGNWIAAQITGQYALSTLAAGDLTKAEQLATKAKADLIATFGQNHPLVAQLNFAGAN